MNQKSKMVSFRVSTDEYVRLRAACQSVGLPSISELARAAMTRVIEGRGDKSIVYDARIQDLRGKIERLSADLDHLSGQVAKARGAD